MWLADTEESMTTQYRSVTDVRTDRQNSYINVALRNKNGQTSAEGHLCRGVAQEMLPDVPSTTRDVLLDDSVPLGSNNNIAGHPVRMSAKLDTCPNGQSSPVQKFNLVD